MKRLKIYLFALLVGIAAVSCTDHAIDPPAPLDPMDKAYLDKSIDYAEFLQTISAGTNNVTLDTQYIFPYTSDVQRFILDARDDLYGYAKYLYPVEYSAGKSLSNTLQARRTILTFAPSPRAHDSTFINLMVEALGEMIAANDFQKANGKDSFLKNFATDTNYDLKRLRATAITIDSLQSL